MHLSDSPAAQDLLDLLRRSPDTFWTAAAAASAAGLTTEDAAQALDVLEAHGLVRRARGTTAFRYAATEP